MNKSQRLKAQQCLTGHLDVVMQERSKYHLHRYKSKRNPQRYLTVIIDGMDNSNTHIPRERRLAKGTRKLTRLRTHLVGAIAHSGLSTHGKRTFCCFDLFQYPHDPNLTVAVLFQVLMRFKESLPPTLYLQLDNCWKENKNKFVFSILALIVELKIFDKVRGNFLPVGHTHEDIDGQFGNYSQALKRQDVYTFEGLLTALEACTDSPHPEAFLIPAVFDIKAWLAPFINDVHGHVRPHCFKFMREPTSGKAVMLYRKWSNEEWMGPVEMLKGRPEGIPPLVEPSLRAIDLDGMKHDIPKFFAFMPPTAVSYWKDKLEHIENWLLSVPEEPEWPLNELLQFQRPVNPTTDETDVVTGLQELRDKEMAPAPEITLGRPLRRNVGPGESVEQVDDITLALTVDSFVAVNLRNWDKTPVIGKVIAITDKSVNVHYWKGGYNSMWQPDMYRQRGGQRGEVVAWTQELPKESIILANFEMTDDNRLPPATKRHLKEAYKRIKEQRLAERQEDT